MIEVHIFLSHSTSDREIAEQLTALLHSVFGDQAIEIAYSSDQDAGRGIQPGAGWLPWITERIRHTDKTYVLLTPTSMSKPWVLWEAGAAAGVALATTRTSPVVPITFGISDADVPGPLRSAQRVRGDSAADGGIARLLQAINDELEEPVRQTVFDTALDTYVDGYIQRVGRLLQQSAPIAHPLDSIPQRFDTDDLVGLWVTCFEFTSGMEAAVHADVLELTVTSERVLRGVTTGPEPRTARHQRPYRSMVEMQLADRHLVGTWRNLSDDRYFGSIHLAVQDGKTLMTGHYTSFDSDARVGTGPWRWVRVDPATTGDDLDAMRMRDPDLVHRLVSDYPKHSGPVHLDDVAERVPR